MPSMWPKRCDKTVLRILSGAFAAGWGSGHAFDEHHALFPVNFIQANFYNFGVAGLHRTANESGLDRQFAMPSVNQHAQAHAFRAPEVEQTIHGGPNRSSGVKHMVDQDEILVVHWKRDVARLQDGVGSDFREVVTIQRDIQRSDGYIDTVNTAHGMR